MMIVKALSCNSRFIRHLHLLLSEYCTSMSLRLSCCEFMQFVQLLVHIACTMHRCGLLLQWLHIAWSECLCVLGTTISCAKMA